jgi:hypothetical protein
MGAMGDEYRATLCFCMKCQGKNRVPAVYSLCKQLGTALFKAISTEYNLTQDPSFLLESSSLSPWSNLQPAYHYLSAPCGWWHYVPWWFWHVLNAHVLIAEHVLKATTLMKGEFLVADGKHLSTRDYFPIPSPCKLSNGFIFNCSTQARRILRPNKRNFRRNRRLFLL